jgi:ABC-type nitrate/sulfonate/bicarbonate transport system permease component
MQFKLLNFNIIFVYLFVLGVLGLASEFGLVSLRRWLCPWFQEGRA